MVTIEYESWSLGSLKYDNTERNMVLHTGLIYYVQYTSLCYYEKQMASVSDVFFIESFETPVPENTPKSNIGLLPFKCFSVSDCYLAY